MKEQDGELRDVLERVTCSLVDIPTENNPPGGDEKEGQRYVKGFLEGLGLAIAEFSPIDVPGYSTSDAFLHERSYQGRKNVVGVWKGTGGGRSLLLSGHIDVAPQTPLPWTVCEPYHSIVKGDEIFGRGAADMKGGLACALVAIKMLHDRGFVPRGDIIFESVVDEEFAGSGGTIASRLMGYNADFGILLEPSGLMICPACVGGIIFKVRLKGSAGMPYTGEEVDNPVYYLPDIIRLTREWDQNRKSVATRPHLWEKTPQEPQIIITRVKAGEVVGDGQLSTPIDAWMEVIVQTYPGEKDDVVADDYSAYLRERVHDPSSLTVEREYHYCRPAMLQTTTPAVDNLAQSAKRFTDKAIVCGAMFSCDLYAFELYGKMPAVIFGPLGRRLHGPDECVDIPSLEIVTHSLIDFAESWCS